MGSHCSSARGAIGGSVPYSRTPQSWYWGWRERWLITLPTNKPCRTWDSNPQPLDYKSNSLTIRPRLPLSCRCVLMSWLRVNSISADWVWACLHEYSTRKCVGFLSAHFHIKSLIQWYISKDVSHLHAITTTIIPWDVLKYWPVI